MAMTVFTLAYMIGNSGETGHITKMRNDLYRMFHINYGRIIRRRDLDATEYAAFMDEFFNRHPHAGHDFGSLEDFRDFVALGRFDVDQPDWSLLLDKEEYRRAAACSNLRGLAPQQNRETEQ